MRYVCIIQPDVHARRSATDSAELTRLGQRVTSYVCNLWRFKVNSLLNVYHLNQSFPFSKKTTGNRRTSLTHVTCDVTGTCPRRPGHVSDATITLLVVMRVVGKPTPRRPIMNARRQPYYCVT